MGQQIETKPYFFNNELKLIAIVKTKVEEETQTVERKTHLMNVNGEKVLDIDEYNLNITGRKCLLKVNQFICYDTFFVVEAKRTQNKTEKTVFKAYSYHGKLLQAGPGPWSIESAKKIINRRIDSNKDHNF